MLVRVALGYLLFVVYGSLVPLEMQPLAPGEAWRQFVDLRFLALGAESRADWIANGVLYLPLGLLLAQALRAALGGTAAALLAWLICAAVAVGVEFAQLYFPPRTVSQNDLLAEGLGAALGVACAPWASAWFARLLHAVRERAADLAPRLIEVYALAWLGFSFFPYDVVLSGQELSLKLNSDTWGWLWAPAHASRVLAALKWLVEVALVMPLGLWWAWRRKPSPGRALAGGLLLGAVIETGQFFILSGVSEGASVLSRGLGVLIGSTWLVGFTQGGTAALRASLLRLAPWLAVPYGLLLLVANGWLRSPWQGADAARGVWSELRLLPFYYHYFTSEAAALFSLASVTLMYLPLAAWAWARQWPPGRAAWLAAGLALAVEASKLFLAGMRPDPTNVLIAAAACGLPLLIVQGVGRGMGSGIERREGVDSPAVRADRPESAPRWLGWLVVAPALAGSLTLPALGGAVFVILGGAAALVWWRPASALLLVLLALPVFDLAPWTGRLMVDEFDLLLGVCCVVAWARTCAAAPAARTSLAAWPLGWVAIALGIGTARALWPWPGLAGLADPMSPLVALHIVKGGLWAWLFARLVKRLRAGGADVAAWIVAGMVGALAATVAVVLWERIAFTALFDFSTDYRVTGPFSAMHRGGAYLECFLVLATAFVLVWLLRGQHAWQRVAAAMLLVLAGYAVMVTYSRNGYVAWTLVLVLGVLLLPSRTAGRHRRALQGAAVLALAAAVGLPIAMTGFARERIEQSLADLRVREKHWLDAIALHDGSLAGTLFGMGLARFPEMHYWRSQEAARAASLRWMREPERPFLRLGPGAPTYVEQWVARPLQGPLQLSLDLRAEKAVPVLEVALCEKWMLTSAGCAGTTAKGHAAGTWQTVELTLEVPPAHTLRPLKFSLLAPGAGVPVDVGAIRLRSTDGRELLANGDFEEGAARWFWSTDVDPPWHIHSLPLALWFDLGWFGVFAFAVAVLAAAVAALRRWQRGQLLAPAALVALAGMLTSGLVNSLVDGPRFLFLLLVLIWLCGADDAAKAPPAAS